MIFSRANLLLLVSGVMIVLTACGTTPPVPIESPPQSSSSDEVEVELPPIEENLLAGAEPVEIERAADVPPLPFPDNPDPALCGIPQPWNSDAPAYLSGIYEDELIQPIIYLYDSHLRRKVVGAAPHGTEVKIILSQSNPELNYYLVKIVGADGPTEGWVPAPFVSFEPPPTDI